jgi:DhnA family fructose-bisphosphate aldolase class Ia
VTVRNVPILASDGRADAVMTTFGVAKRYREQLAGRIPTIMRLDGGPSLYREDWLAYTEWSLLFSKVTDNCPVPVLIAGGPRMETADETLQVVQDAIEAGAAGVVFGRNIWQSGDTRGMIRALNSIIHEGRPAAEALAESDLAHRV